MDDQLLVRVYNVGLGDCIYVRVPDKGGAKHLLIDCGNKYSDAKHLAAAITNLKEILPDGRLDLLVVTHSHEDHVKGFDPEIFDGLEIDRLWMSTAINSKHPQAENAHKLQGLALQALQRLALSPKPGLSEWAESMLALSKSDAMDALTEKLPVGERLYVHTDTPAKDLKLFKDKSIRLRVLAPVDDIDGVYLGKETAEALAGFQAFLDGEGTAATAAEGAGEQATGAAAAKRRPTSAPRTSSCCAAASRTALSPLSSRRASWSTTPASCCCSNGAAGASCSPATPR